MILESLLSFMTHGNIKSDPRPKSLIFLLSLESSYFAAHNFAKVSLHKALNPLVIVLELSQKHTLI